MDYLLALSLTLLCCLYFTDADKLDASLAESITPGYRAGTLIASLLAGASTLLVLTAVVFACARAHCTKRKQHVHPHTGTDEAVIKGIADRHQEPDLHAYFPKVDDGTDGNVAGSYPEQLRRMIRVGSLVVTNKMDDAIHLEAQSNTPPPQLSALSEEKTRP
jgi:hypothetical protein